MSDINYYIDTKGQKHSIKPYEYNGDVDDTVLFLIYEDDSAIVKADSKCRSVYVDHNTNLHTLILHDKVEHIVAFGCPNLKELKLPKACTYLCCDLQLIEKYYEEWMHLDCEIIKPHRF